MKLNSTRREARSFVFQYFYHHQMRDFENIKNTISNDIEDYKTILEKSFDLPTEQFILRLINGVISSLEELKVKIEKKLNRTELGKLSSSDLTLILLGSYEILYDDSVPNPVVINEYIELAKKFGTETSPSFVNGVLNSIANNNE